MKFFDSLKMALHNIFHNRSRTILTIVIVLIVGSLLMMLNVFALAFSTNMDMVCRSTLTENGAKYSMGSYRDNTGNDKTKGFTKIELEAVLEAVENNRNVVDTFTVTANSNSFEIDLDLTHETSGSENMQNSDLYSISNASATSYCVPLSAKPDYITSGRIWTNSDRATNGVWVSESFIEGIYKKSGTVLKTGSEFLVQISSYDYYTGNNTDSNTKVQIKGIFDSQKINVTNTSRWSSSSASDIYIDIEFMYSANPDLTINDISMTYLPATKDYNFKSTYASIVALNDSINKDTRIRQYENNGIFAMLSPYYRFNVDIKEQMDMVRLIAVVLQGLMIFISFIILLLSVGSVANTIIISTDKNKKFIGLMKAMGLKNKGVSRMVNLEAALQIFIGIGISFLIMVLMQPVLLSILEMALGSIVKQLAGGVAYTLVFPLPWYVPVIVFLAFLGMALISAKRSLASMLKMDVIAIMSEVA